MAADVRITGTNHQKDRGQEDEGNQQPQDDWRIQNAADPNLVGACKLLVEVKPPTIDPPGRGVVVNLVVGGHGEAGVPTHEHEGDPERLYGNSAQRDARDDLARVQSWITDSTPSARCQIISVSIGR